MNKKQFFLLAWTVLCCAAQAQSPRVDSMAVYVLDRAAEGIQHLSSCSYVASITYDVPTENVGLVKHSYTDRVSMRFPDKMKIQTTGDKGRRQIVYDGKNFFMYSYDTNRYVEAQAQKTILETMHIINNNYGIEFPAADFFYPSFVDDIIATGGDIIYLGTTMIGEKECHHIAGKDVNDTSFQFWISDITFLPVKMVMVYGSEKWCPQYEAYYTDWILDASLPDSMFSFAPPPSAAKTKITPLASSDSLKK